jgi:hypothetical protein
MPKLSSLGAHNHDRQMCLLQSRRSYSCCIFPLALAVDVPDNHRTWNDHLQPSAYWHMVAGVIADFAPDPLDTGNSYSPVA